MEFLILIYEKSESVTSQLYRPFFYIYATTLNNFNYPKVSKMTTKYFNVVTF